MERLGWAAIALAALALPALTANTYYLYVAATVGLLVIVTAGLNVLVGFTGQISLGHAGFYAIGAYTAALLTARAGWRPLAAVSLAILLAALVGAGVAAAALRVSGPYLAMVTIAFGIIVEGVLIEWVSVTGGPGGIFNIPKPGLLRSYWLILVTAALALWLVANLRASAWGRAFLAVRGSEVAAESLGLSAYYIRIVAFTISAAFAGAGGALFAFLNGYISPDSFTLQTSILFLLALLFGGTGYVAGPVVGSLVFTLLPELLTSLADYRLILYGGLLMLSIYRLPAGVVGALRRILPPRHARAWPQTGQPPADAVAPRDPRVDSAAERPLLRVEGASLSFGGVTALVQVTLSVPARGITAVIGPNGAGKTTLLNVLSGYYSPDAGIVRLGHEPVAGKPPYAIARLGVARTFQTAQLFGDLTVLENVAVGVAGPRLGSPVSALLATPWARRQERDLLQRAVALIGAMGLLEWAGRPAEALPAGLRRRLEIIRALARRPRLLLLDEPAAGLNAAETEKLIELLFQIRDRGITILLVEHDMSLVMNVSDQITVLNFGKKIAEGTAEEIERNQEVIDAYLGTEAANA